MKDVLEYDGRDFAGWQQQAHGRTVEAELKRALLEVTGAEHKVYAAGRTDAGAHAEGQVVSFETDGRITPQRLVAALNARLPGDVSVVTGGGAPAGFPPPPPPPPAALPLSIPGPQGPARARAGPLLACGWPAGCGRH